MFFENKERAYRTSPTPTPDPNSISRKATFPKPQFSTPFLLLNPSNHIPKSHIPEPKVPPSGTRRECSHTPQLEGFLIMERNKFRLHFSFPFPPPCEQNKTLSRFALSRLHYLVCISRLHYLALFTQPCRAKSKTKKTFLLVVLGLSTIISFARTAGRGRERGKLHTHTHAHIPISSSQPPLTMNGGADS